MTHNKQTCSRDSNSSHRPASSTALLVLHDRHTSLLSLPAHHPPSAQPKCCAGHSDLKARIQALQTSATTLHGQLHELVAMLGADPTDTTERSYCSRHMRVLCSADKNREAVAGNQEEPDEEKRVRQQKVKPEGTSSLSKLPVSCCSFGCSTSFSAFPLCDVLHGSRCVTDALAFWFLTVWDWDWD
jgi:hypothetical protein